MRDSCSVVNGIQLGSKVLFFLSIFSKMFNQQLLCAQTDFQL
jgi:hypothetical protein